MWSSKNYTKAKDIIWHSFDVCRGKHAQERSYNLNTAEYRATLLVWGFRTCRFDPDQWDEFHCTPEESSGLIRREAFSSLWPPHTSECLLEPSKRFLLMQPVQVAADGHWSGIRQARWQNQLPPGFSLPKTTSSVTNPPSYYIMSWCNIMKESAWLKKILSSPSSFFPFCTIFLFVPYFL